MPISDATRITPLSLGKMSMAYPLIKTAVPTLSLEEWEAYATSYLAEKRKDHGIIAVEDERGYYFGLFTYYVRQKLGRGKILMVENMIAADLYGRDIILGKLMDALALLQRDLNCEGCEILLTGQFSMPEDMDKGLVKNLQNSGFIASAVSLRKSFETKRDIADLPTVSADIYTLEPQTHS